MGSPPRHIHSGPTQSTPHVLAGVNLIYKSATPQPYSPRKVFRVFSLLFEEGPAHLQGVEQ